MTRSFITGLTVAALAVCTSLAMAGDYHSGTTLMCADCHTMHYSLSHGYDGGTAEPLGAGGPHARLLKGATPNETCLTCHDGQTFAPDVLGENATGSYVRQAGALTTGTAPYEDWKGHTLGSTDNPPGNTGAWRPDATEGLECINCHGAHGDSSRTPWPSGYTNGNYRLMTPRPGNYAAASTYYFVKYAKGTNSTAMDVFERDATLDQPATHYAIANVDFNEPDTTKSAYADWCKGCHTDFHGTSADANMNDGSDWVRHPSAGVDLSMSSFKAPTGKTNFLKVMDPAGQWDPATGSGYTPSCFTCHKAHGNKNAFGLIQMSPTGTVTEEGTETNTGMRSLCKHCHGMGGSVY